MESQPGISKMIQCPVCDTTLEPWQIECHYCGQFMSSEAIPIVEALSIDEGDLEDAFSTWIKRGRKAFKLKSFDEAHACYAEALKRVCGVEGLESSEIKARQCLADAFEKLGKKDEAREQLVIAQGLLQNEKQKLKIQKKVDELNIGKPEIGSDASPAAPYRYEPCNKTEKRTVRLFCASCTRLMTEAEVYPFRCGRADQALCVCGVSAPPLVLATSHLDVDELIESGMRSQSKKDRLIEAAQKPVEGGRTRVKAFWMTLLLGTFGVHKFYLGDRAKGYVYLALSWTLIPLVVSIYEAILIAQMSRVSFNLVYNIEKVLERLPVDDTSSPGSEDSAVLSMIVCEEPDDLVDDWSSEDEV